MNLTISPTESDVFAAVRAFLLGILPSGDMAFTGAIVGDELTVGAIARDVGALSIGDAVLGTNVLAGTIISALDSGTGKSGTYKVSPSQDTPSTMMSNGVEVIQAQINRVPEPVAQDFITMTFTRDGRLGTNLDANADVVFQASIAAGVMTVSGVEFGAIVIGANVWGEDVAPNTTIRAALGGNTYAVAPAQAVSSQRMAAGGKTMMQPAQATIQLDIHGPNSADFAQIIATAFRDEFSVDAFTAINPLISPLFNSDPRQMPFMNAEQQYEDRWVVELELQVNQTVRVPQQFADVVTVTPVNVDATYPVS